MSDPDLSFGDVLHDAFADGAAASGPDDREVAWVQMPPLIARPMTPEDIAWHQEQLRLHDLWCFQEAGAGCARWIAASCNLPYPHVWAEMTHLPENALSMIDSPAGWSVLAAVVTRSCRESDDIPPFPTVH